MSVVDYEAALWDWALEEFREQYAALVEAIDSGVGVATRPAARGVYHMSLDCPHIAGRSAQPNGDGSLVLVPAPAGLRPCSRCGRTREGRA